jgi:hypothetical protein
MDSDGECSNDVLAPCQTVDFILPDSLNVDAINPVKFADDEEVKKNSEELDFVPKVDFEDFLDNI